MKASAVKGALLDTLGTQESPGTRAKNVSATHTVRSQSLVIQSQGGATARREQPGGNVMGARTGMHVKAQSVFSAMMNAQDSFSTTWLAFTRWP